MGLLTGDIIENREGSILVMTTEVLRNMLLQTPSELWGVGCIIFDEIHYLADPERGTTWEESIIMCPPDMQLVCLSATVTNARRDRRLDQPHARARSTWSRTPQRAVPLSLYYYLDGELHLVINARGRAGGRLPQRGRRGAPARTRGAGRRAGDDDDGAGTRERPEPTRARDRRRRWSGATCCRPSTFCSAAATARPPPRSAP